MVVLVVVEPPNVSDTVLNMEVHVLVLECAGLPLEGDDDCLLAVPLPLLCDEASVVVVKDVDGVMEALPLVDDEDRVVVVVEGFWNLAMERLGLGSLGNSDRSCSSHMTTYGCT